VVRSFDAAIIIRNGIERKNTTGRDEDRESQNGAASFNSSIRLSAASALPQAAIKARVAPTASKMPLPGCVPRCDERI
jgi:hypothetical protein